MFDITNTKKELYLDLGGTVRSQSPNATLAWLQPLFKIIGITRVANITGLDNVEIPVAVSIRPNSKHLTVSQGKGLTWELAMISAVMESVEGFHAENVAAPLLYGAYSQLAKDYPVYDPKHFAAGAFTIPQLENWSMGWISAFDINKPATPVLIPHVLTCLDTTRRHPEYSFFLASTNGLAAGNSKDEAICHAICEIIERDCFYRWTQLPEAQRANTQLKLDTIHSTINQNVIEKFIAAKQLVKIWEITSPLGIPSFHCVIKDANPWRSLGVFRGTGTHLRKEIALSRALTEAAQSRLTLISGTRDDVFAEHYHKKASFTYSSAEYQGTRDYKDCYQPPLETGFQSNIEFLCRQLTTHGFGQVLVVDHTRADLNIPVVHVFIPGMQFNGTRF